MKEIKLSPRERELLEHFHDSDTYQKALKPLLVRKAKSELEGAAQNALNFEAVLVARGKAMLIKELNAWLKSINKEEVENTGN